MNSKTWPVLPYHVGGPVWDERRFAGRKGLLSRLKELAEDPDQEGFILSGPRRFGKSSVLERLKRLLGSEAKTIKLDLLSVLLDTDDWAPRTLTPTVLRHLLDLLEEKLGTLPPHCRQLVEPPFSITAFRTRVLPDLISTAAPQRLVILLDEMEVAQARDPVAHADISNALQPLPGFRGPKPFLGIVWGRAFGRGASLTRDMPSRLKDFAREELTRFSSKEIREAIQQPVSGTYHWHKDAIDRVASLTSGHPLFIASIGAAVHARRHIGDKNQVSLKEVNDCIKDALVHAESWDDAWGQLNLRQRILLRALADSPGTDLDGVVSIAGGWDSPYKRLDFEPLLRPLIDDGLITATTTGLHFQVDMIARWIHKKEPTDILGAPEDPRIGVSGDAAQNEQDGKSLYEKGQLDAAAVRFRAALEQDPARWSAAIWLARILIEGDEQETAAEILRVASPTAEVRHVRAQVLAQCLKRALERHEDATQWITELRTIDPHYQEAPEAAQLIAGIQVDEWWRALQRATPAEAVEATDHYVLGVGAHCIDAALRRVRAEVDLALEGASSLEEVSSLIWHVLPYLLHESEPSVLMKSLDSNGESPSDVRESVSNWERCYATAVSALTRLSVENARLGFKEIPPSSILRLLECRVAAASLGAPLRALVLSLATADHLADLSSSDASAARGVVALLELVDRAEGIKRLGQAFSDASLAASTVSMENSQQFAMTLRSLPALGLGLVRLLHGLEKYVAEVHFHDLITASGFVIEKLELDPALATITVDQATVDEWQNMLAAVDSGGLTEVGRLQARLQALIRHSDQVPEDSGVRTSRRIEATVIQKILGAAYRVDRQVPYRIHGVPPGYVWAWSVNRLGRTLLARAYRVDGGEPAVQAFLAHLWDNERRLLSTLSTRWEGRALPRLYVSRFEPRQGVLVLVTDFVGPQTLRDLLNSGEISRLRRTSRASLWIHLQGIIEALAALHRAGYIHRAVRPENVLADPDVRSTRGHRWLRLSNFEWSVYLYGIASSPAPEAVAHDRYVAPEGLAIHRSASDSNSFIGESTASDAFALGLVLFECLVEPLHSEELMPVPTSYGIPEHLKWINQLLDRIHSALNDGELSTGEVELLTKLLRPDPSRRTADLDSLLDRVSRLAQQDTREQAAELSSPLHLVTTLQIGTKESIARFIQEDLPTENFADIASLERWIEEELQEAVVRPNRRSGAPILLEGKSLNFTVHAFKLHGNEHSHIGWLKVAKEHDGPAGAALGRLPSGVKVHNYRRDMKLAPLLTAPNGWGRWFSAVERVHEGLTVNERAFVDRIRWTIELERAAWERHVLPFERVEYSPGGRPGEFDLVVIRDREDPRKLQTYPLDDLMAQSVDRENIWFELGTSKDPTSAFHPDRRWIQVRSDSDSDMERGLIRLMRHRREGAEEPPVDGWIRPYSLAGHRTLYERRKEVLADVEHDPFLVRSILTPEETFDDLNLPPTRVFDPHLDADKQALAIAIRNRLPLFVVQGPPGTGKTTLAAEVILRTLHEQPSSRILVVAQAHDPLNNLLERVEKALDGWKISSGADRRPTSVRLTSEERLDERRYGQEGTRVPRRFHPSRVAAGIMTAATAWRPGPDDVAGKAFDAWQRLCATQALHGLSRSLERRLVASANVVYATTNDRRLAAIRPGSFDLVIFEETAKALPSEVLGPLRLARRWVLIGDQAQLPPFGLDDIDEALKRDIQRLREVGKHRGRVAADTVGVDPTHILGEGGPPRQVWSEIGEEMTRLLRFFDYVYQRAARVPLTHSMSSDDTAGAIQGLSGMLTTQWRMHPVIGDFVSKCFYQGRVRNGDPERLAGWRRHGLISPPEVKERSIVWLDTPWVLDQPLATERHGFGGGAENGFEARVVMGFIRLLLKNRAGLSLAIMSPYRAQVSALGKLIQDYHFSSGENLQNNLHTADSFQGKQADVVVVSLVRNNRPVRGSKSMQVRKGIGFLESPERSTVIFSRAEKLLVIVGCMKHFKQFPDTSMFEVVQEIESLALKRDGGVVIVNGQDFIEPRYWEDLQQYHERYEERLRIRREAEDRRLTRSKLDEFA